MIARALLPLALVVTASSGTCPSDEAVPVLQMDKIIGEWNGTHFYGEKTSCSRVEIAAQGQDKWSYNRISRTGDQVVNLTLQQPDKKSGRLKATDLAGSKSEIIILTSIYDSHILLRECAPDGKVATTFLRRPTKSKMIANADLETALYDANVRKDRLQFCEETRNACKKWKTVVTPLDERRMQGVWKESGRIRTSGAPQKRNCVNLALEPARGTNAMFLRYSYNEDGKTSCVSGNAKYKYPGKKAAILTLNQTETGVGELWVLDTNYDTYAVVSLCSVSYPVNREDEGGVLVLTRSGVLTSADAFAINAAIISVGNNDFVQQLDSGFDRLNQILDIAPQICEVHNVLTCGVDSRTASFSLICGFLIMLLAR